MFSCSWQATLQGNTFKIRVPFPRRAQDTESKTLFVTFSVVVKTTGTVYYQSDPKLDGVTLWCLQGCEDTDSGNASSCQVCFQLVFAETKIGKASSCLSKVPAATSNKERFLSSLHTLSSCYKQLFSLINSLRRLEQNLIHEKGL